MSETLKEEMIWIVTEDIPEEIRNRQKSWRDEISTNETTSAKAVASSVAVNAKKLEQEMNHFLSVMGKVFNRAEKEAAPISGIHLEEIELSIEISGEGKIKLLGSGAKANSKGAIKLKFKRINQEKKTIDESISLI